MGNNFSKLTYHAVLCRTSSQHHRESATNEYLTAGQMTHSRHEARVTSRTIHNANQTKANTQHDTHTHISHRGLPAWPRCVTIANRDTINCYRNRARMLSIVNYHTHTNTHKCNQRPCLALTSSSQSPGFFSTSPHPYKPLLVPFAMSSDCAGKKNLAWCYRYSVICTKSK